MDSNEEYLDQLLKSMTEPGASADEAGRTDSETGDADSQSIDELLKMISMEADQEEKAEASQQETVSEESAAAPDLDAAASMSQSEIEQRLAANRQEAQETEQPFSDTQQDDFSSLLAGLGEESSEDVQEISELLNKADHDEPVDDTLAALLQGLKEEEPQNRVYSAEDLFGAEEAEQQPEKPGRRKKKERVKKEKKSRWGRRHKEVPETAPASGGDGVEMGMSAAQAGALEEEMSLAADHAKAEKKPGLLKKMWDALMEEDEEEDSLISDENNAILQQMDQEEQKKAKGKKNKKSEKKEGGKDKQKKQKKPKKEKKGIPVIAEEGIPEKKLPLKRILPILLAGLTVAVAYVAVSQLYIGYASRQRAEDAFYAGNYQECYELLFGRDLNESEAVMYHKSELALKMERAKKNYQTLLMEGKELEALDYLVQFLCRHEEYRIEGQEWNSLDVVEETYTGMTGLLTANYGLTEDQALEIAALVKDTDYTLALMAVLEGTYAQEETQEEQQEGVPSSYEDLLPEELEDQDAEFIDSL